VRLGDEWRWYLNVMGSWSGTDSHATTDRYSADGYRSVKWQGVDEVQYKLLFLVT